MRKILNEKGAAMMLVMIVMIIVLMMSTLLVTISTMGAKMSKREFALTEDRMIAQKIGRDFVDVGVSMDTSAYSNEYEYEINQEERTLTVKRKDDSKLLEVKLDAEGHLISWREYYR